jgi:hypothetical protein
MDDFFLNFDWDGFWLNTLVSSIFFLLSIIVAITLIPFFTVKYLKKRNKKYITRKKSSVIQEICEFINYSPYKDSELDSESLSISTSKNNLKTLQFIGICKINVLNPIHNLKIFLVITKHFEKMEIEDSFQLLQQEKTRISKFREIIERVIEVHSLHLDDDIISEISDLCLDIRSFDIYFKTNHAIDDLIESGYTNRKGIFGANDLAKLYQKILELLIKLLNEKEFDYEIRKTD